jgi:transposase
LIQTNINRLWQRVSPRSTKSVVHAYSEEIRNNILALLHHGLSIRQVAARCQVSRSTVHRIRAKHAAVLPRPVAHYSSKIPDLTVRLLARRMRSKKPPTIAEATKSLETEFGLKVTRQTVRNALHKHGMKPRRKNKEAFSLTEKCPR